MVLKKGHAGGLSRRKAQLAWGVPRRDDEEGRVGAMMVCIAARLDAWGEGN